MNRSTKHKTKRKMTIILTVIFLLLSSYMYATATDQKDIQLVEIAILPGDSLWKLANTYYPDSKDIRKTIYDIKKLNNIDGHIYAGQIILLALPINEE